MFHIARSTEPKINNIKRSKIIMLALVGPEFGVRRVFLCVCVRAARVSSSIRRRKRARTQSKVPADTTSHPKKNFMENHSHASNTQSRSKNPYRAFRWDGRASLCGVGHLSSRRPLSVFRCGLKAMFACYLGIVLRRTDEAKRTMMMVLPIWRY